MFTTNNRVSKIANYLSKYLTLHFINCTQLLTSSSLTHCNALYKLSSRSSMLKASLSPEKIGTVVLHIFVASDAIKNSTIFLSASIVEYPFFKCFPGHKRQYCSIQKQFQLPYTLTITENSEISKQYKAKHNITFYISGRSSLLGRGGARQCQWLTKITEMHFSHFNKDFGSFQMFNLGNCRLLFYILFISLTNL